MKILIVDDNAELLQILQALLTREGHRLEMAGNGWEGYERALVFRPDLVITDLGMPLLDGLGMIQHIRRHMPRIGTVYMSGAPQAHGVGLEVELRHHGALLIEKPFSRSELLDAVSACRAPRREGSIGWKRMRVAAAPAAS
jgi:DNA-binding response OmpR family regulator